MDTVSLQARARKARDQTSREKHQLLANAWAVQQGEAMDRVSQRISVAREELRKATVAAADQGKDEVTLLRMSFQPVDLRLLLQAELHASLLRSPDPYPGLRAQGPPAFRTIESWLKNDLKLKEWEKVCPLDWLMGLQSWLKKMERASWLRRWAQRLPRLPEPLLQLWDECKQAKVQPRFEPYRHMEDEGIALVVRWKN